MKNLFGDFHWQNDVVLQDTDKLKFIGDQLVHGLPSRGRNL